MASSPYIEHYTRHGIAPVAQDISDLTRHLERRSSLFRLLGVPPSYIRRRKVLEFGPGTGHNAIHVLSQGPSDYVFVDANPTSLEKTAENIAGHVPDGTRIEFVHSLIEDFESEETFDLVMCEGLLQWQLDPSALLRHVARFAAPGAIVIATTSDTISAFAEILRRVMIYIVVDRHAPLQAQVDAAMPFVSPHFQALPGMSRFPEDWLMDELKSYHGEPFAIPDAIACLQADFDVQGCSPQLFADWRWYKDLYGEDRRFAPKIIDAYWRTAHDLLDCRFRHGQHNEQDNRSLYALTDDIYRLAQRIETSNGTEGLDALPAKLQAVRDLIAPLSPETASAIADFDVWLHRFMETGTPEIDCGAFKSFWGRGQQYLSFLRFS